MPTSGLGAKIGMNWVHAQKTAAHVYGVKSSHAERLVQIHADSHEYDGESLWLLLNREIEAVFNRPVEWKRKEFTNPKRAYTDDEL